MISRKTNHIFGTCVEHEFIERENWHYETPLSGLHQRGSVTDYDSWINSGHQNLVIWNLSRVQAKVLVIESLLTTSYFCIFSFLIVLSHYFVICITRLWCLVNPQRYNWHISVNKWPSLTYEWISKYPN